MDHGNIFKRTNQVDNVTQYGKEVLEIVKAVVNIVLLVKGGKKNGH